MEKLQCRLRFLRHGQNQCCPELQTFSLRGTLRRCAETESDADDRTVNVEGGGARGR